MKKLLLIALMWPGLAWGQSYNDHTTEYQLDAEQAEQLTQNGQIRERQYAQQLQMQSMQQRLGDLEFQRLMKEREEVSDPNTYFH